MASSGNSHAANGSTITRKVFAQMLNGHLAHLERVLQDFREMEGRVAKLEHARRLETGPLQRGADAVAAATDGVETDPPADLRALLGQLVERNRHVSGMALLPVEGATHTVASAPVAAGMPIPEAQVAAAANSAFYEGENGGNVLLGGRKYGVSERDEVGDFVVVHLLPVADDSEDNVAALDRSRANSGLEDENLGPGLPARWTLEAFRSRVCKLLDEFLCSLEADEAVRCFREFVNDAEGFSDEVVVRGTRFALEKSGAQQEQVSNLLHLLHREGVLDTPSFLRGFAKLACTWEDLAVDYGSFAPAVFVNIILGCVRAGCVEPQFITKLPEGLLASVAITAASDTSPASEALKEVNLRQIMERLQQFKRGLTEADLFAARVPTATPTAATPAAARGQVSRAASALRQLQMPEFHHEYVKRVLAASLDWPTGSRGLCADLLRQLLQEEVLTAEDLHWGVLMLLGQLEDLTLDCPKSTEITAEHLRGLLLAGLLSVPLLKRIETLRIGGAKGLAAVQTALALASKSDTDTASWQNGDANEANAYVSDDIIDVNSFLTAQDAFHLKFKGANSPGAFLCSTNRWVLAVAYEVGMDPTMAKKVCVGTAEYLVDEGQ